jgi:hypothetical protein
VTIITDGYENASHEYTHTAIRSLIESYKEQGWQFTYIGADHDVEQVAFSLNIDHSLQFDKTEAGTQAMFACERRSRKKWLSKMDVIMNACLSPKERNRRIKETNEDEYFE